MILTDLHIHSCLSPCADDTMTPAAIVKAAKDAGLELIAITDHNSARNCPAVAAEAEKAGIGFIPGIEVTTTITPTATGHRRHHEIESSFDCDAYDCGFAVPNFAPDYGESAENDTAEAHCDTLRCAVRGKGEPTVIGCDPNTSLYFTNVHLPAVKYHIAQGHTTLDTEIFDEAD